MKALLTYIRMMRRIIRPFCLLIPLMGSVAEAAPVPVAAGADARPVITVALTDNFQPYSFAGADGQLQGILKDMWELWSRRTGIEVRFVAMDWPQTMEWLAAGRVDVGGAMVKSDVSRDRFLFSKTSFPIESFVYFRAGVAGVKDVESLKSYPVGAVAGARCAEWLRQQGVRDIRPYPNIAAMAEAASNNEIDVVCTGRAGIMKGLERAGRVGEFRRSAPLFTNHVYWAVRLGNVQLYDTVRAGFERISDAERQAIVDRWNGEANDPPWHQNPVFRRLLLVIVGGFVVALALMAWTVVLRRQVAARTAELETAGKRHLDMIANLPGGVFRFRYPADGVKRLLFADGSLFSQVGLDIGELLRQSPEAFATATHPDDYDLLNVEVPFRLRETGSSEHTFRFISPDGRTLWFRAWERVVDRDGDDLIVEGMMVDVTAEIHAREDAARKERWMSSILDNIPDIAWLKDMDGRYIVVNRAVAEAGGVASPKDMVGHSDFDYFPVHEAEGYVAHDRAVMASGRISRTEELQTRADGSTHYLDTIKAPLFDVDGVIVGTVGIGRDITGRKAMERSLREASARVEALIDNLPGVVYRKVYGFDEATIVFVSDQCRVLFGRSPGEICALSARERLDALWHPGDHAAITAMTDEAMGGRDQGEAKVRARRPDGSETWVLIREKVVERTDTSVIVEGVLFDINAEISAREALEASERRYRELIEDVNVVAWEWDIAVQRFVYVSRQGPKLTGFPVEEWLAPGFWVEHIHPDDRDLAVETCMSATARGEDHDFEYRMVVADGGVLWVRDIVHVHMVDGKPHSLRGLMLDITEQVNARMALEHSEAGLRAMSERLATLIDRLPGVAFRMVFLPDGLRWPLYFSGACEEIYGAPAEEICSWPAERFTEFVRAVRSDGDIVTVYQRLDDHGHFEITQPIRALNGPVRHLLARGKLVGRDGDALIAEGIVIDVTAQQVAEDQLREVNRTLDTLIGNIPGNIFRLRIDVDNSRQLLFLDGGSSRANPESRRHLLSLSPEEFSAEFHPDDRDLLDHEVPRRLRESGISVHTIHSPVPGRWMRIWERVASRAGGEMVTEGIMIDVTDEIQAKAALEREEEELQATRERLREARRLGALGDLAGGIAHDFNNLLGAILGFATFIAEDTEETQTIHRHADRILGAARRGKSLVDQILTLTGRRGRRPSRFPLIELATATADSLTEMLPAGAALRVLPDPDSHEVMVDRDLFGVALRNLCVNGLEALEGQGGTVSVAIRRTDPKAEPFRRLSERAGPELASVVDVWRADDGAVWAVTGLPPASGEAVSMVVSDGGGGMDGELLEKAFTPFFTSRERAKNPGLGLPVAQGVVLAHGGALAISSRPGKGTSVEIVFPPPISERAISPSASLR